MARLSKELLKKLVNEGFFDSFKSIEGVVKKLDQKGFSINGKKVGLLSQLLTFLCQDEILEREKDERGNWSYKRK